MVYLGFPLNDNPNRFDKKELKKKVNQRYLNYLFNDSSYYDIIKADYIR